MRMGCTFCKYRNGCDGAACYYDEVQREREQQPDYDEKKWYMVDMCSRCAYTDKVYSKRDIDEHARNMPDGIDDMHEFLTREEIEADTSTRWDTDDSWLEDGKRDAEQIIAEKGLEEVFSWWKDYDRSKLTLKSDIGFYNELMRQAEAAGLKK